MNTLVKSFGIPFLAGLAGAALWTGISAKSQEEKGSFQSDPSS
jgi:hypothetical protein